MNTRHFIRSILFTGYVVCALCLTACGAKTADEDTIKSDILGYKKVDVLDDGEALDEVTITDRNTEKKSGVDRVICSVTSHDAEKSYVKGVTIVYTLDEDDKEWEIEDLTVDPRNKWKITPNALPTDDVIRDQIVGQSILADGEEWLVSDSNLAEISVKDHSDDIENLKDRVTVNVTVNDTVEKLHADLTLDFGFEDGWKLNNMGNVDNVEITPMPGTEIEVDESKLLDIITSEKLVFGSGDSSQKISAGGEEISDFEIADIQETEKGTIRVYNCSFSLQKVGVGFHVDTTVEYQYISESGWSSEITDQTLKVTSIPDISGKWAGESDTRYSKNDIVTLEINKDSDGKIRGVYNYDERTSDYIGEYEVAGTFDEDTLELKLDAGEWITEPKQHGPFEKDDVNLVYYAESGKMSGRGHEGSRLTVDRAE